MFKATEMFMQEANHGVEIDPLWGNYFDDNLQKVIKWCECIRRQKWLFDDSCDESTLVETSGDSQPAVARPANPRQPLNQLNQGFTHGGSYAVSRESSFTTSKMRILGTSLLSSPTQ